ncbi:MAG TPA: hypothetical protein VFJ95_13360 [Gammaproteobacteria bacterium]|nr:hypothetical protein [Gammaproteobacteria bacterium]
MSARQSQAKRPSLGVGIGAGLVLSVGGAAVLTALWPLVGYGAALRAVVALLGLAYVLYVLSRSGERVGRVTTVVAWALAAALAWASGIPFVAYVLVHVGLIWLVRSLYFYSGVLAALADLGLSVLGAAFAVWAAHRSGSALLAFWCFFLVQAFHVLLPAAIADRGGAPAQDTDLKFNRAHAAAEAAIRRLSAGR